MTSKMSVWLVGLAIAVGNVGFAHAGESFSDWLFSFKRMKEVAPVSDATYNKECGSCHFPYQPGLLPAASWQKLLDAKALEDHFGDNAELDDATRKHVLDFAVDHAADNSYYKRSRKIMSSLRNNEAPLRIMAVPYIEDLHESIPSKLVKNNPQVKSFSNCNKCHQRASAGIFDDDTVSIPSHGYWTW